MTAKLTDAQTENNKMKSVLKSRPKNSFQIKGQVHIRGFAFAGLSD